eukprot:jgi/Mesvir1/29438/Mv23020-RA.1
MADAEKKEETAVSAAPKEAQGDSVARPSRARKQPQVLTYEAPDDDHAPIEIPKGAGTQLRDIPNVEYRLKKVNRKDKILKDLHRVLFKRPGKETTVKQNIGSFSGFVYENKDKDQAAVRQKLMGFQTGPLGEMLEFFDLHKSGTKEERVDRLIEFFEKPADQGKGSLADKATVMVAGMPSRPSQALWGQPFIRSGRIP